MSRGIKARIEGISIGVRLGTVMVVMLIGALAVIGLGSILLQRRQMKATVHQETQRLAESLESSLRAQMLQGHTQIGDAVTRITRQGGVEAIALINHKGEIRYATDQRRVGRRVELTDSRCSFCHVGGAKIPGSKSRPGAIIRDRPTREISTAIIPIYNAPACANAACHVHNKNQKVLGVLTLEVPYRRSAQSIRTFRNWLLFLSAGLAVVLFVVVVLLLRRWVTRPVAALVAGTRTVAQGDLTHTIPAGEAELGELSRAFNQMQERLQTSQQQLVVQEMLASMGKLAAGVAHEINNPLTGVLSFAEDLYEEADEDDPLRGDYELILNETLRCREIVKNLLDFGRQKDGRQQTLSLVQILERPLRLVQKHPEFHDTQITMSVDESLPAVRGDPGKLQQVVLNLLLNASQAMPDGGRLTVSGHHDAKTGLVCLEFTDTGAGIPPEDIERIFEAFYSTKVGTGSGIGLAVCRTIIEQHGGRLEVESELGKGTTFRILLDAVA